MRLPFLFESGLVRYFSFTRPARYEERIGSIRSCLRDAPTTFQADPARVEARDLRFYRNAYALRFRGGRPDADIVDFEWVFYLEEGLDAAAHSMAIDAALRFARESLLRGQDPRGFEGLNDGAQYQHNLISEYCRFLCRIGAIEETERGLTVKQRGLLE